MKRKRTLLVNRAPESRPFYPVYEVCPADDPSEVIGRIRPFGATWIAEPLPMAARYSGLKVEAPTFRAAVRAIGAIEEVAALYIDAAAGRAEARAFADLFGASLPPE